MLEPKALQLAEQRLDDEVARIGLDALGVGLVFGLRGRLIRGDRNLRNCRGRRGRRSAGDEVDELVLVVLDPEECDGGADLVAGAL